jgi:hypothetical protein
MRPLVLDRASPAPGSRCARACSARVQIVRKFSSEQRCRLLQFVTGTSRVPATGFKDLWGSDGPRKFCVERWGTKDSLPRSHTWSAPRPARGARLTPGARSFNRIDLPPYEQFEIMESKMALALEQGSGFAVE